MEGAFTVIEAEEDNKTDVNEEKKNPPIESKSFEAEDSMNLKDQGTTKKKRKQTEESLIDDISTFREDVSNLLSELQKQTATPKDQKPEAKVTTEKKDEQSEESETEFMDGAMNLEDQEALSEALSEDISNLLSEIQKHTATPKDRKPKAKVTEKKSEQSEEDETEFTDEDMTNVQVFHLQQLIADKDEILKKYGKMLVFLQKQQCKNQKPEAKGTTEKPNETKATPKLTNEEMRNLHVYFLQKDIADKDEVIDKYGKMLLFLQRQVNAVYKFKPRHLEYWVDKVHFRLQCLQKSPIDNLESSIQNIITELEKIKPFIEKIKHNNNRLQKITDMVGFTANVLYSSSDESEDTNVARAAKKKKNI